MSPSAESGTATGARHDVVVKTAVGDVAARIHGAGSGTVLLLHPLALAGDAYDRWAFELGDRRVRVVAPTLPAGSSDQIGEVASVGTMAAQAAALLDALESGPAWVVGLSMGGCVALQLALDRPDLVDRLVLADTTSDYGPDKAASWELRAKAAEESRREDLLDFQTTRWFSESFVASDPAEVQRLCYVFVRTPASIHAASCRGLGAFSATDRLGEVHQPVLVLVGEQDQATPPKMAEALSAGIVGSQLKVLDGVRHFSLFESADARRTAERFLFSGEE